MTIVTYVHRYKRPKKKKAQAAALRRRRTLRSWPTF
jgi:hypothetical protein